MRHIALPLLLAATFVLSGVDVEANTTVTVDRRDTPQAALGRLKRAVAQRNYAGEWATVSFGFKQRMNKRAGRTIDPSDYEMFRREQRRDPQVRQVERFMRTARMGRVRYDGKGYASATITFGGPLFFGRSIRVRLVNHHLWRLDVKGESQPYWGYKDSRLLSATRNKDGSYTIKSQNDKGEVEYSETFAASEVVRYREFTKWYFDSFGRMETQFFGGGPSS
ncbi:MAG: hypothetical protein QNJ98_10575 [Planctomycetota bacterium]|nr:hypothetical protein [Planctomycetota bacterium]